ncbi:MAG: O-antigen ligase family protein [Candidatus Kuenenbacteria bacterium]
MALIQKILNITLMAVMVSPIVFSNYFYYPFITGKVLAFRILVILALILFTIYLFLVKKIKFYASPIWWMFLSLIAISFLSALFGVNFTRSFWSNIERADGVIFLVYLFVFLSLLIFSLKTAKQWRWLFRTSLAASLLVIGYGLLQHFGLMTAINTTGVRVSSVLGNPAYLGSYALIHVFLCLYLISKDQLIGWRIFYFVGFILNFWVIFLTQTRGAVIGLLAGLVSLAILTIFRNKKKNIKKISAIGLVLLILLSFLAIIFKNLSIIQNNATLRRVTNISLQSYTVQTRLAAWSASLKAFKDKPIFGWGIENYGYAYSKYFPPEIYVDNGSRIWFDKAHNVFFEYLVTEGILGVLAYFGLLGLVLYYLFKSKRLSILTSNLFISLIIGYTAANMFVFDTMTTYILFAAILGFTNNIALAQKEKEISFGNYKIWIFSVFVLFFLYLGYVINVQAIQDNKKILYASAYARENEVKTAYDFYTQALDNNNNFTRFEIRREFAVFVRNQAGSKPDYQASPMFDRAIQEMEKSIKEDPSEIRHYYNLSQLYLNSYKFDISRLDKLIDMGPKMIELAPNRAHTYYQIGEAYILKKDYDNALLNFQKAVELNPKVIDTYINVYAVALLKADSLLEAETKSKMEEVEPEFFEQEKNLLRYLPMYRKTNRGDLLVQALEKLIRINPEKVEYVSSLAIYYAEIGENKKAEDTIKTLLGRDPE